MLYSMPTSFASFVLFHGDDCKVFTMQALTQRWSFCIRGLGASSSRRMASTVAVKAAAPSSTESIAWTPEARRTGVLAKKLGMTAIYDSAGVRTPVTVLEVRYAANIFAKASSDITFLDADGRCYRYCDQNYAVHRCTSWRYRPSRKERPQCIDGSISKERCHAETTPGGV